MDRPRTGTPYWTSILVTGAAGFVGRHLLPLLGRAFPTAEITALTREPDELAEGVRLRVLSLDLLDEARVEATVAATRPDIVVHLAAQSSVGETLQGAADTWAVNVGGTLALARALALHAPGASVLFASSGEVYGRTFNDGPLSENALLAPDNAYARSKVAAEGLLGDVLPSNNRLIVARPLNHAGVGQNERFVMAAFAAQIARIEAGLIAPVLKVGNLSAERDFLDVEDVVAAYVALLLAAKDLPPRSVFNVASGRASSVAKLLETLRGLSLVPFEVQVDEARLRPLEVPRVVANASRLTEATGWRPKRRVEETLARVLDDWRQRIAAESGVVCPSGDGGPRAEIKASYEG